MLRLYKMRLLCAFSVSLLVLPLALAGEDFVWTEEDLAALNDMPPPQPKPKVQLSEAGFQKLLETDRDLKLFNPRHCPENVKVRSTLSLWHEQALRIIDDLAVDESANKYRDSANIIEMLLEYGDAKKLVVLCDQHHNVQAIGEVSYVDPAHGVQLRPRKRPLAEGIHLHLLAAAPSVKESKRASKGAGRAYIKLLVAQSLMQAGSGLITVEAYRGARRFYSGLGFGLPVASYSESAESIYLRPYDSVSMHLLPLAAERLFADAFKRARIDSLASGSGSDRVTASDMDSDSPLQVISSFISPCQAFPSAQAESRSMEDAAS